MRDSSGASAGSHASIEGITVGLTVKTRCGQGRTQGGAHGPVPSPYNLGPLGERARNMASCDLKGLEGQFGGAKGCLLA